jgi:hypothetical protein
MNKISMDKQYTTRMGDHLVIISEIFEGRAYGRLNTGSKWEAYSWPSELKSGSDVYTYLDLIEKPEVIEGWVNLYPIDNGKYYTTSNSFFADKNTANKSGTSARVACIPIKFTIGEGLDNE